MRTPASAVPHVGLLVVAVALGGAIGAVGRWTAVELTPAETGFPWTTFTVNVTGSFVLALAPAALTAVRADRRRALLTAFVGPGLLGGWTTLSAYAEQARALLADGAVVTAAAYVAGTLAACLAAVAVADRASGAAQRARFSREGGDE